MRKVLRTILALLVVLAAVGAAGVAGVYVLSQARFARTWDIQPLAVQLPSDEQSIAYGEQLAQFYCAGCHGGDLAGMVISVSLLDGTYAPPNLTAGQGGVGGAYVDEDWVRAIRHGVGPDGRPLLGMPSNQFEDLDEAALGALIAYVRSVPPVNNSLPGNTIGLLPRVNFLAGRDPLLAAELLDHDALIRPPEELYFTPIEEGPVGE